MKSSTPQQATWKTSDGSPWWLRSTRYSEPNGDYHSNCFLNLGGHPHSAETLQFNDWKCNIHSRSYYCQPARKNEIYKWKGKKAPKIVKKKHSNCKLTKDNGVGGCYPGKSKSKKQNAKEACESVYGLGQCITAACGSCNGRGYHGKGVPKPCNGATMWNFKNLKKNLGCGWQKCSEVLISKNGKTWMPSCANHKFDIRPGTNRPLCRRDNCVVSGFDMGRFKGVQLKLHISTLTSAGWKVWSDQPYKHHTKRGEIQPNRGDCMLWGSKVNNRATKFHVAAMGRRSAIVGKKGVMENGVYWYTRYPQSNGFAPNSKLSLGSADTSDNGGGQFRMSWHLHRGSNVGGWRSGNTKWLNSNTNWRKVVMYGPCKVGR